MNRKKRAALGGVALTFLLALFVAWASFRPRALETVKDIAVTVTHGDGTVSVLPLETTARYLDEALRKPGILVMEETENGSRILAVDGEYADPGAGTYWFFTVNGAYPSETIRTQPVTDGDSFGFYLLTY